MDGLSRFALFAVARDAGLAAMAAGILMLAFSVDLPVAFVIGASVFMLFSGVLLFRAFLLSEARVMATQGLSQGLSQGSMQGMSHGMSLMQPQERAGDDAKAQTQAFAQIHAQAHATEPLETLLLTTAKSAAGVAALLFALGLLTSWA